MSQTDLAAEVAALPADPLQLVAAWIGEAEATGMINPGAMTLATTDADGGPSARTVLLRGADEAGFRFFTHYASPKGRHLAEAPRAQLVFYWRETGNQILVHGEVEQLSAAESDAYFATRPRGSQLGAWASEQSSVIESRDALLALVKEVEQRFDGDDVPRPPHWGGYIVKPESIEFWRGGEFRLNDRFIYRKSDAGWAAERLSP